MAIKRRIDRDCLWCSCGWSQPIYGDQFRTTLREDLPACPRRRWWNWPLHQVNVFYGPTIPAGTLIHGSDSEIKRAMKKLDDGIPATSPLRPAINELVRQQYLKDLRPAPDLLLSNEEWIDLSAPRKGQKSRVDPDDGGDGNASP